MTSRLQAVPIELQCPVAMVPVHNARLVTKAVFDL